MRKILFLVIILFCAFFIAVEIKAGAEHNVWGWAWSENIGWISFNNANCDTDGNGFVDSGACGGDNTITSSINYGVHINSTTGIFSGYAWSESIGWISFNSSDIVGYPFGACNLDNMKISGWARARAAMEYPIEQTGGWDGWIRLRDTNYGLWLDNSVSPNQFRNWAWGGGDTIGGEIIGWSSFNCSNQGVCGASDYKVMTSFASNQNPFIDSLTITGTNYCLGTGKGQISFEWTYRDDDGDNQKYYWLEVNDGSGWTVLGNPPIFQTVVPDANGTSQAITVVEVADSIAWEIEYDKTYDWRVMVEDDQGNQSSWVEGPPITTPSHAYPHPSFTPNPDKVIKDQPVVFDDQSICYLVGGSADSCENVALSYLWDFGDGTTDSTIGDVSYAYSVADNYTVRLDVTDDEGTCFVTRDIEKFLSIPKWREILPF